MAASRSWAVCSWNCRSGCSRRRPPARGCAPTGRESPRAGCRSPWAPPTPPAPPLMVTFVPGLPRMRLTASESCMSLVVSPSILTMRSPGWRPARKAGVPSMGDTTVRMSSRRVISMPSPPKLPEVSTCISFRLSGIEERAVGIEAAQGALDGAVDQLLGGHVVHVLVLDDGEDLGEEPELLVGRAVVGALAGDRAAERQREHQEQRADHERLLHGRLLGCAPSQSPLAQPLLWILGSAPIAYLEIQAGARQRAGVAHRPDALSLADARPPPSRGSPSTCA